MLFESVFDSLDGVQEAIERGRVDASNIVVNVDANSLGVFLYCTGEYFEGYDSDEYYMEPDGEHEHQCLFYDEFGRPQELLLELLSVYLGSENTEFKSINYRSDPTATRFIE